MEDLQSTCRRSHGFDSGDGVFDTENSAVTEISAEDFGFLPAENCGLLKGEWPFKETIMRKPMPEGYSSILLKAGSGISVCYRCGHEEMLGGLEGIKCPSCRSIIWSSPCEKRYERGRIHATTVFPGDFPVAYVEALAGLKERLGKMSWELSFHYGEHALMDFELSLIPKRGLYKGAKLVFSIDIPFEYPYESPVVRCKTKIYHPHIDLEEGNVGIDFLGKNWKLNRYRMTDIVPALWHLLLIKGRSVRRVRGYIRNHEAGAMWKDNPQLFYKMAREALGGGFIGKTYFPRCLVG